MDRFGEGTEGLLVRAAEAEAAAVVLLRAADIADRTATAAHHRLSTVVWESPEAEARRAQAADRHRETVVLASELRTAAGVLRRFALEQRAEAEGRP